MNKESDKKPVTNNPGELNWYIKTLKTSDPSLTVKEAWEVYTSPNHEISVFYNAMLYAGFSTDEINEYFRSSKNTMNT